jgi:hypothetical protein
MSRRHVLVAVAAAAICLCPLVAAQASAPGWTESYTSSVGPGPNPDAGQLTSVVAFGPGAVLAAGYVYTDYEDGYVEPIIKHWNGETWTNWKHLPKTHRLDGFIIDSISGSSLSNVWIVRSDGHNPKIEHWNGRDWMTVSQQGLPPSWTGTLSVRHGRIVLVGNEWLETDQPFIAMYDRDAKTPHWVTGRFARSGSFTNVTIRTAKDMWAVGSTITNLAGTGTPIIEHFSHGAWARTPVPPSVQGVVTAIAATGSHEAMAVGYFTNGSDSTPIALHWDGTSWTSTALPAGFGTLNAVVGGGDRYWAAGNDPAEPTQTTYFRYVGGVWTTSPGPMRAFTDSPLQYTTVTAMTHIPGTSQNWAVGFHAANDCNGTDDCPDGVAGDLIIDHTS